MYFPCLYARGAEKDALKKVVLNNNIVPIIRPALYIDEQGFLNIEEKNKKTLDLLIYYLIEQKIKFILDTDGIEELTHLYFNISNFNVFCILGISKYSLINRSFSNIDFKLALIHKDTEPFDGVYLKSIEYNIFMPEVSYYRNYIYSPIFINRILINDAFHLMPNNRNYPDNSTFKTDLPFVYKSIGLIGFGDYTILAPIYKPMSKAQLNYITATLHLTFMVNNGFLLSLHTKHFKVTPEEEPDNMKRIARVLQLALDKRHKFYQTNAWSLIEEKAIEGTNLGVLKQIGIMHHIELMGAINK